MAKPWEKYQPTDQPDGPWARHSAPAPEPDAQQAMGILGGSPADDSHGNLGYLLTRGAARMNTGIANLVPNVGGALGKLGGMLGLGDGSEVFPDARTALADAGGAYGWDQPAEGYFDTAMEMAGPSVLLGPLMTLGMAGQTTNALQQAARSVSPRVVDAIRTQGEAGRQLLATRPGLSTGIDFATGAGAGAGMEAGADLASALDLGPSGTAAAEGIGAMGGGMAVAAPRAIMNTAHRLGSKAYSAMFPDSELRAAREIQGRAVGAQSRGTAAGRTALEQMDQNIETAVPGASAARATGSDDLMSLEAKVAADDPVLGERVSRRRQTAIDTTEALARRAAGTPRGRIEWAEYAINTVLPPGAARVARGNTQEMLKQAEEAYKPAYDTFRQFAVPPTTSMTARQAMLESLDDPELLVNAANRETVRNWVNGVLPEGRELKTANDLIELRHKARTQLRNARAASDGGKNDAANDKAELLDGIEESLTKILNDALDLADPAAATALKAVDDQYRKFKVMQDAVYRTGDRELDPARLETSIRTAAGRGRFARGDEEQALMVARQGRDAAKMLDNPDDAARYVRGLPEPEAAQARSNLSNALLDKSMVAQEGGRRVLSGRELTKHLSKSRESLRAAGFTDEDIGNLERTAATLNMLEKTSPLASERIMTDKQGTALRLISGFAGITGIRHLAKLFGVWDKGASIRVASKGARAGEYLADRWLHDGAERLIREAHMPTAEGRALYRKLLTRPTDPEPQRAEVRQLLRSYAIAAMNESLPEDERVNPDEE